MNNNSRPGNLGWIVVFLGALLVAIGVFLAKSANSTALVPAYFSAGMVCALGLIAVGVARFARREEEEREQVEDFRSEHANTELFDDADEAFKLAARTNEHYHKYFIPFATAFFGVIILLIGISTWQNWAARLGFPVANKPLAMATLCVVVFLGAIISGSYFVGASREKSCRWLRPAGGWLFFTGALFLSAAVALTCEYLGKWTDTIDPLIGKIGLILFMILGAEFIVSMIIEFYRPRIPGEEVRPLVESRFLALFVEPGGVARNMAASLDYQFGFKVSEAGFYRFLERALAPLLLIMAALLWLQTCVIVIKADENGIRETWWKISDQTPMKPGIYFKLPSPFARIYKFPVDNIQEIPIGYEHLDSLEDQPPESPEDEKLRGDPTGQVIVWALQHNRTEQRFVVASKNAESISGSPKQQPVTVYLMNASVPLYFKVTNLYDYKFRHDDAAKTLKQLASREVVRYLANVDFFTILTEGREEGAQLLAKSIQKKANDFKLGVEIVFVGLQGIHPPPQVGGAFDEVIGSVEMQHEIILRAQEYRAGVIPEANGWAKQELNKAMSYKQEKIAVPIAEAARFEQQLLGYNASPQMFMLNSFLDVLENEGSDIRKYIIAAKNSNETVIINLEKKMRVDLTNLTVDEEKKEQ